MDPNSAEYRSRLWTASRQAAHLLSGERPRTMAEQLADLAAAGIDLDRRPDFYGDGVVAELEQRVADLLGVAEAVWFPTGTMAQQAALRHWADLKGSRTVALHPLHHTLLHEGRAFETVAGLQAVYPTEERRHPTADEVRRLSGPLAALVLELPLQELGYPLPSWNQLLELAAAAKERGAALHVDGARLWETVPWFGRPLAEVAGVADSVYLSFYKAIGALSGSALAGGEELAASARLWRLRYGGKLFSQWPTVVLALQGLDLRLPRIPDWTAHARGVAAALRELGLEPTPAVPHVRQFHVLAPSHQASALNLAMLEVCEAEGWRFLHGWRDHEDGAVAEMTAGEPALDWQAEDVVRVGAQVLERARALAT